MIRRSGRRQGPADAAGLRPGLLLHAVDGIYAYASVRLRARVLVRACACACVLALARSRACVHVQRARVYGTNAANMVEMMAEIWQESRKRRIINYVPCTGHN